MANEKFTLPESIDALTGAEATIELFEALNAADLTDVPTEALATFLDQIDAKSGSLHSALSDIPSNEINGAHSRALQAELTVWEDRVRPLVLRSMTFEKLQSEARNADRPSDVYTRYLPKIFSFHKLEYELEQPNQKLEVDGELLLGIICMFRALEPHHLMRLLGSHPNMKRFFEEKLRISSKIDAGLIERYQLVSIILEIEALIRERFPDTRPQIGDFLLAQTDLYALRAYLNDLMRVNDRFCSGVW